jgi:hypothetical protein
MREHVRKTGCKCGTCRECVCFVCAVCECYEGSLTTECPGEPVGFATQNLIYTEGKLDFRDGQWVRGKNPANQELDKIRERNRNSVKPYKGQGTWL